jgi:hypothetical protein
VRGKDCDILVIQRAIIIVRSMGEVVCLICGAGFVDKFKIEFSHFWEIARNMVADLLGVAVILQV